MTRIFDGTRPDTSVFALFPMPIVATIAVLAGLVWALVYARAGSLLTAAVAVLLVGYVLGHSFWNMHVGPLPITLDRLLLVGAVAMFLGQWRWGLVEPTRLAGVDWLFLCLLGVVTLSALMHALPESQSDVPSPFWRLVASFWIPGSLYWIVRQARIDAVSWRQMTLSLVVVGVYLSLTAIAEAMQQWWAVFPSYISNPQLGTHFGRARGPMLNSASLGMFLTVCIWCAWVARRQVSRPAQLLIILSLPLMVSAIYFTYTRSAWLGLAGSAVVVLWLVLPRTWRLPVVGSAVIAGLVAAVVVWGQIVDLRREGSTGDAQHSVSQRTAFAYLSWQMFKDHPLCGVGFGRFYDQKLSYLSDRSQNFELESLRPLHHHSTLLSVLTETGMIGLAAMVALVVAWTRYGWALAGADDLPDWSRAHGLLMLAVLAAYLPGAVFHDITYLHTEVWLLAIMAGVTVKLAHMRVHTSHSVAGQRTLKQYGHLAASSNT